MILYYLIFTFGVLLIVYTTINFFTTKKKINAIDSSPSSLASFWKKLVANLVLWKFYFVGGKPQNLIRNVFISCIIFLAGFYVNYAYIKLDRNIFIPLFFIIMIIVVWKWGQRRNRIIFENSFPEVIQILNSATTAGAGLLQALERCGKDISGQLGDEFKKINKRLAIGEDASSVLEDSYTRYPYKEFYFFIIIIRVNLEKGGQMREVISRLGRVIADSRKMEQKKKAMTSEARISAMIVSSFPFCFFIFMKMMMPENFDFVINDPNGRIILYYVLGSEFVGIFIVWWLMRRAT
ncbi:type II secretion system F family protein [Phocoenobacter skyensis]|uniref:Tight adherence protein B n=1 Tax=Phocoenobacter skyensis TaxID=97481 RepID=A0A1H7X521_9PAST|nr:type II secretion system F family protein [Pasteurella skyensis]MDP8079602.1 type II secretion system F family protein [Pasteurella skyensis]MDP8085551.1 type II secretion system F family protein [Pasteurella skyensis]MDP8185605.1 type II secretion system F family protein [Pasteurella skyensis]QLB21922.1 protein dehydratase [Pasteurella skyensis]SEM28940.1 tight adherence protein B [Pasteurella skyensis]